MWYETELTIPAGTLAAAPVQAVIKASYGVIHRVVIEAAPGCHRLASVRVYYHEHQIYPTNPDADISLDGIPREFDERQELFTEPYDVIVRGYAPNASYAHVYRVGIGILRPEAFPEYRADSSLISKIAKLIGVR